MRLENRLRDIQPDRANFRYGRLLQVLDTPTLAHQKAVGGRPTHQTVPRNTFTRCKIIWGW